MQQDEYKIKNSDYDLRIDVSSVEEFSIGGKNCSIQINDAEVANKQIHITHTADGLMLDISQCMRDFLLNEKPCNKTEIVVRNRDFFSLAGYYFFYLNGMIYTACDGSRQTLIDSGKVAYQNNHLNYPKFVKNTRQLYLSPKEQIEVLDPKPLSAPPEKNIVKSLIPSFFSLILIIVFRGVLSASQSGKVNTFVFYSAGMMLMGIGGSIVTYFSDGRKYEKDKKAREEKYREYLAETEEKIVELRNKEHEIAWLKNASVSEDIERVASFDSRLFEKKKEHEDYLNVYLGQGVLETKCPVKYKPQDCMDTEDYLMDYPKSIHDKYEFIEGMPVVLDLKALDAIGFIGTRGKQYQIIKNLVINISVEHFYKDVKMFFIIDKEDIPQFEWARWFQNAVTGNNAFRNFMYDSDSAKIMLEYLYKELSERESLDKETIEQLPDLIIFVYRSMQISNHPIMKYVKDAKNMRVTFIFFEEYPEYLNDYCQKRIFLDDKENFGTIIDVENGEEVQEFSYEHIPLSLLEQTALKLSCVYVDEFSLESNLTKNISLFELLNIDKVEDIDLKSNWANSKIYESMAAPLGVKSGDEIVYLDIHEKFHGPHGLVAGTTGSGKSEIIQSYMLSMATLFHPYEVGFIIIDFKGGGMANQFRELPHLNGAITNIDGKEIDRSLLSIKAELNKRQELFAKYSVNHIDDYIKAYKNGVTEIPLPHLILVVDEFAELKSDQPEFMKELISAARIGRSLGVHLILATQKPSGVVNEQIWSNSKFKLCLKVQNKQDSNEVIKSPLAAEIREPGRAYLQVGNNEIFQLFQSAYSGAPAVQSTETTKKKYRISKVHLSGQREVIYEQKGSKTESISQLDAIVKHIKDYCDEIGFVKLPDICLPPLSTCIYFSLGEFVKNEIMVTVPIGMYDDPTRQKQDTMSVNLTQSNLFLLGSSQMGKTNMIQTLIKGIAEQYGPDEVNIYILDFATMVLKNLDGLAHIGGVVTASDDDKLKNLFKLLSEKIKERKELLSNMGLSSFSAYKEAGFKEIPQIIVFIDNVSALKEIFPGSEETLSFICREGLAVGVTVVATNNITGGMGLRFLTNFATKIAFSCNNKSEYGVLFERCKLDPGDIPGRAIIKIDKEYFECQTYLAFDGEKEIDRTRAMKEFIASTNEKYASTKKAEKINFIPNVIDVDYMNKVSEGSGVGYRLAVGLDFETTDAAYLALASHPMIGFYGKRHFGKFNFIKYMLNTLNDNSEQYPVNMYFIDNAEMKYKDYKEAANTKMYSNNMIDTEKAVREIHEILKKRQENVSANGPAILAKEPMLMLILNTIDSYRFISDNKELLALFKACVKDLKSMKVCVLLTELENGAIGFNSCDVVKLFRDDKVLFIFEDMTEQKLFEPPLAAKKQYKKNLLPGEAYRIINTGFMKIKTPHIK